MVTKRIPLSEPSITSLEIDAVTSAIKEGWISGTGPQVKLFEKLLSERINRPHAIACTNGTLALEATIKMLGIGRSDQVIVPALTFVSPAAAVVQAGASPVFADIDPLSWTINPEEVFRKRTPQTRAVIAVDLIGHPADYDQLKNLDIFGTYLIEDAAEAHGSLYKDKPTGSFGVAATFSFHANKGITGGEAGAIVTHHDQLAEKLRLYINHGMRPETPYYHELIGTNGRLANLQAAVLAAQMQRWDTLVASRNQIARWYDERLPAEIGRRPVAEWATASTWLVTVTHPERDRLLTALKAADIDARAIWPMLPSLKLYNDGGRYPVATRISQEAFWLPTSAKMTLEDVEYVVETIKEAL